MSSNSMERSSSDDLYNRNNMRDDDPGIFDFDDVVEQQSSPSTPPTFDNNNNNNNNSNSSNGDEVIRHLQFGNVDVASRSTTSASASPFVFGTSSSKSSSGKTRRPRTNTGTKREGSDLNSPRNVDFTRFGGSLGDESSFAGAVPTSPRSPANNSNNNNLLASSSSSVVGSAPSSLFADMAGDVFGAGNMPLSASADTPNDGGGEMLLMVPRPKQRRRTRDADEMSELAPGLQVVANFLKTHNCFELVPASGKVVVLETQVSLLDALAALADNELFSAPVWHATQRDFVGLMSPLELVDVIVHFHNTRHGIAPALNVSESSAFARRRSSLSADLNSSVDSDNISDIDQSTPSPTITTDTIATNNNNNDMQDDDDANEGESILAQNDASSTQERETALRQALSECTVGRWLNELAPSRQSAMPAAPLPQAHLGSPLLAARARKGAAYLAPDDTLWDAARALLAAPGSKLPLLERQGSQSALCVVTLTRVLSALYAGLRQLPKMFRRSLKELGIGGVAHIAQSARRRPPPAARISAPLSSALGLMARERRGAVPLLDDDDRPAALLVAADVPALVAAAGAAALHRSCAEARALLEPNSGALLTCSRSTSLADVIKIMAVNRVHQLVIVDSNGRFEGIVTASHILRFLTGG